MKIWTLRAGCILIAIAAMTSSGCTKMSESILDKAVGMNGGFEVVERGLPVNWLVYTPATIPTGEYDLIIDTVEYQSGKQSLKFAVRECSSVGGWHSPGFAKEYKATPGVTYTIGIWVKNDAAEFVATIGGVSAFEGESETIVRSGETIATWKHFEHEYTMPQEFDRLRFEINVVRPGTFWIDEVTISRIGDT